MQPVPPPATACGRDAQRARRGALADAAAAAGLAPRLLPGRDGPGHREELGSRAAAALSGHCACSGAPAPGAPPPPAASARWVRARAGGARAGRGGARGPQAPGTTAPARAERAEPRNPPPRGEAPAAPGPQAAPARSAAARSPPAKRPGAGGFPLIPALGREARSVLGAARALPQSPSRALLPRPFAGRCSLRAAGKAGE